MNYKKIRVFAYSGDKDAAQAFALALQKSILKFFKAFSMGLMSDVTEHRGQFRAEVALYFHERQFENIPTIKETLVHAVNTLAALDPAIGIHAAYVLPVDQAEIDTLHTEAKERRLEELPTGIRDLVNALEAGGTEVEVITL